MIARDSRGASVGGSRSERRGGITSGGSGVAVIAIQASCVLACVPALVALLALARALVLVMAHVCAGTVLAQLMHARPAQHTSHAV